MGMRKPFVRFVIKFAERTRAFLEHGAFSSTEGKDLSSINEWLRRYPPSELFSLFGVPASPGQEPSVTEESFGLDRFFCVVLEANVDEAASRLSELNRMPFLEEAYVEEPTELAQ